MTEKDLAEWRSFFEPLQGALNAFECCAEAARQYLMMLGVRWQHKGKLRPMYKLCKEFNNGELGGLLDPNWVMKTWKSYGLIDNGDMWKCAVDFMVFTKALYTASWQVRESRKRLRFYAWWQQLDELWRK